jgi:hypothetical protein
MHLGWVWALLGIVLLLGVVAITVVVTFVHAVQPPVDAMNDFLTAVEQHHYDTAYSMLCRDEQASTPRDQFAVAIRPFVNRALDYNVYSFDPFGPARTVRYTVTDIHGHDTTYQATVVHENGAWRVCDFFK